MTKNKTEALRLMKLGKLDEAKEVLSNGKEVLVDLGTTGLYGQEY